MPDLELSIDLLLSTCYVCGIAYGTSDGRSHYCSDTCKVLARRKSGRARQAQHRDAHPAHEQCRQILKNAILAGKVRRPARCEHCAELGETEGHHHDYSKPFFVEWLCRSCHALTAGGAHFHGARAEDPCEVSASGGQVSQHSLDSSIGPRQFHLVDGGGVAIVVDKGGIVPLAQQLVTVR